MRSLHLPHLPLGPAGQEVSATASLGLETMGWAGTLGSPGEPREAPSWPQEGEPGRGRRRGHQHLLKARVHRGHVGSQALEPVRSQARHPVQLSSQAGHWLHRVALDGHPLLQHLGAKATGG